MKGALLLLTIQAARAVCLVHGTVIDAATGNPLPGTHVFVKPFQKNSKPNILRIADSQGAFCFERLEVGSYTLSAVRPGYLDSVYGARPGSTEGIELAVAGVETPAVTLKMTRSASISGTVTDASGELLETAETMLWRKVWDSEVHGWSSDYIRDVRSDDRGFYRFGRLAPGNYYLSAEERYDPGGLDEHDHPVRASGPATYYQGSYSFDGATAIRLDEGQEANVNVAILSRANGRSVTARLAPGLEPGAQATLTANSTQLGARRRYAGRFAADGTVSLQGLVLGKYRLETAGVTPTIRAEVDLTDSDVDGLVLAPRPAYDVSISVIGGPADLNQIGLNVRDASTGDLQNFGAHVANDLYQLSGLAPGVYWLEVTAKQGYLKDLKTDGRPATQLDLREGPPASVQVTFSSHLATVGGRV